MKRDGVAQGLQLSNGPSAGGFVSEGADGVGPGLPVGMVGGEYMPAGPKDGVSHPHDGLLVTAATEHLPVPLGQVGPFGPGRRVGALDEGGPKPQPAQRSMSAIFGRPWSSSRSSGSTFTMSAFSVIMAEVRAFTAVSLATFICLSISTMPSASLGRAVATPASTALAALCASRRSLLPFRRRSRRRDGPPRSPCGHDVAPDS